MFLIDDDHIVSLPYDDIKWLHKGCDLCRRLPCYLESGTECDEFTRIAWSISIRCPVEYPRAVPSIEYPLLSHGSIESMLWSIECLEVGYSSECIASPDIWFPHLGSETVDDHSTCGEYYDPLSERSRYLIYLEQSRIDIVRITIIWILFARHFEESISIFRKDFLHMYDGFRKEDSLSRIYLLPIIEYQCPTRSSSEISREIFQIEHRCISSREGGEFKCSTRYLLIQADCISTQNMWRNRLDNRLICQNGSCTQE